MTVNDKFFRSILGDLWVIKQMCAEMYRDQTNYKFELPKVVVRIEKIKKKILVTIAEQREREAKRVLKKRIIELNESRKRKI